MIGKSSITNTNSLCIKFQLVQHISNLKVLIIIHPPRVKSVLKKEILEVRGKDSEVHRDVTAIYNNVKVRRD